MRSKPSIYGYSPNMVHTNHGRILLQHWPAHVNAGIDWPALWSATARFRLPGQFVPTFGMGDTAQDALAACCRSLDYYKRRAEGRLTE